MLNLPFHYVVHASPALSPKTKDLLLGQETQLDKETREAIIQAILTFESRLYDAAKESLEYLKRKGEH